MGWMQRSLARQPTQTRNIPSSDFVIKGSLEPSSVFIDDQDDPRSYKIVPTSTEKDDLPSIPPHVVTESSKSGLLWLVIDDIVYDCTDFTTEHPGGADVLQPFWGTECSWQFRRFHGNDELQKYGRSLRVGRTEGVKNRFKERPRFIGLRRLGADNW